MKVLMTDIEIADPTLERTLLAAQGISLEAVRCVTPAEVIEAGADADAIHVAYAPITREVFARLPRLGLVTNYGVGLDTVDLDAAREHGVWVANVPTANTIEVAMHAYAMILSMARHLPFYDRSVRAGKWDFAEHGPLQRPTELTLGLIGQGNIGRRVAGYAKPCFERIVAYDPAPVAQHWLAHVERLPSVAAIAEASDIVSLHVPGSSENHGLFGEAMLRRMRRGAYLVNVSRGVLVDVGALLAALDDGHLAGAALDVLPEEPPKAGDPILAHPKVLLSPHAAFYSTKAELDSRQGAIENIVRWAQGLRPASVVVEGRRTPRNQ